MSSGVVEFNVGVPATSFLERVRSKVTAYVQLTKPRIILLFVLTGLTAMVVEGSLTQSPLKFWMICFGILLVGASANALNQYIDRDIDAIMERTRKKRPIPQGRISSQHALVFSISIGVLGVAILQVYGNWLAAAYGLGTIIYYVGFYTMYLKRRTPYNIVIGGAAGAAAPLIGWAAATGHVAWPAWIMFAIIFMWTPPHFWALALCIKDEYAAASVPMLPVTAGEEATRRQIFGYSLFLIPLTWILFFMGYCGRFYFAVAVITGFEFIRRAYLVLRKKDKPTAWQLFGYSIGYLLLLFAVMIVDAWMG